MKTIKRITRIRRKIKIRGSSWTIRTKFCLRDTDGTPCLGLCDNDKKLIQVEEDLSTKDFLETLLHEYLHACWYEAGIDDIEPNDILEHWIINSIVKDMTINASFWASFFRL
jgi:hypothetical protein